MAWWDRYKEAEEGAVKREKRRKAKTMSLARLREHVAVIKEHMQAVSVT